MTKHWQECYMGEEKPKFKVKIIKSFTSCLVRQLWEAIRMRRRLQEQASGDVRLLNSRSDADAAFQGLLWRIVTRRL